MVLAVADKAPEKSVTIADPNLGALELPRLPWLTMTLIEQHTANMADTKKMTGILKPPLDERGVDGDVWVWSIAASEGKQPYTVRLYKVAAQAELKQSFRFILRCSCPGYTSLGAHYEGKSDDRVCKHCSRLLHEIHRQSRIENAGRMKYESEVQVPQKTRLIMDGRRSETHQQRKKRVEAVGPTVPLLAGTAGEFLHPGAAAEGREASENTAGGKPQQISSSQLSRCQHERYSMATMRKQSMLQSSSAAAICSAL